MSSFSDTLIGRYGFAEESEVDFAHEQANTYPRMCILRYGIFQASDGNLRVNIGVRWSVCDTNEPPNFVVCTPRNRVVDRRAAQAEGSERKTHCVLLFLFETSEERKRAAGMPAG